MSAPVLMVGTSMQTMGGISTVVRVWQEAGLFEREQVQYIATHRDGGAWAKLTVALGGLWRYALAMARGPRPRLVHIQLSFGASFWRKLPFAWLAAARGVPFIVHLHGSEFRQFHAGGGVLRRRAITWMFDRAAVVCTLSRDWQAWVQGVSTNPRVVIVYNAVAVPPAPAMPQAVPGRLLFLGRMGRRKGTFDLLDAFARVVAAHPQARLHIGGDGDAAPVLARIAALGLQQQVRLLGWVRGADKARELAQASVYVLPSYSEGLPMSVLEAMAAGVPIVSTPVGGIPDAVADGEQGWLVAPGDVAALADRLCRLLADEASRQRMGRAAAARVRAEFSADAAVRQLSALYRQAEQAGQNKHS